MGLNLYVGDIEKRIGYFGVHKMRRDILEATIKYLEKTKLKNKKDIIEIINISINTTCGIFVPINYFKLKELEKYEEKNIFLTGLLDWVIHSDCDGKITPEESQNIINTLKKIKKYLDKEYYYLFELFEESIKKNEDILFL